MGWKKRRVKFEMSRHNLEVSLNILEAGVK